MTRAIVLAGGEGTRLRPYTAVIPKPLLPLGDRPVLEIVLRQLKHARFARVTISTGYMSGLIEAYFADGSAYDLPIDYVREHEPLGTVGSLALIEDLDEPFLLMNGDLLTDLDYNELMRRHLESDAVLTIGATVRRMEVTLGVLRLHDPREPDRLTGFDEKPSLVFEASMGVYAVSPRAVEYIEPYVPLDFPDFVVRLLDAGETVRVWRSDAYWLDIGRHDDYEQAMNEFQKTRHRFIPDRQESLSQQGLVTTSRFSRDGNAAPQS